MNNFQSEIIKANVLFRNPGDFCLAAILGVLQVNKIWQKSVSLSR